VYHGSPPTVSVGSCTPTMRSHFSVAFCCCFGCLVSFVCTFSLFLLLTALHTINHVTRLLPAQSLRYIEVESEEEEGKC